MEISDRSITYLINIVCTVKGGQRVRPARLTVEGGDLVRWHNAAKESVQLTLINGDKVFSDFPVGKPIDIPAGGFSKEYPVRPDAVHGDYPYQVTGLSGQFYNGDSDPRIDVL